MARLTDEQRLLRTVSERAWEAQVEQTLALSGFEWVYHVHDSRRDRRGFPDVIALRHYGERWTLVVAELKTETGRIRPEQESWLEAFAAIACLLNRYMRTVQMIVGVWRPSDAARIWAQLQEEVER